MLEILVFHGYPLVYETLKHIRIPRIQSAVLVVAVNIQKYAQIVCAECFGKDRMHAVDAFNDDKRLWVYIERLTQFSCFAIVWMINKRLSGFERFENLFAEPLKIYIPSGLSQPLRRPLRRPEEKMVHGNHIAGEGLFQQFGQGRFPGARLAVDRCDDALPFFKKVIDFVR